MAAACAHVFASSEREAAILRRTAPGASVTTITNGVSVAVPGRPVTDNPGLVFTGVMDYWPNVDAMQYFVRDILPIVRRQVPEAALVIVGQRPTRHIRDLARVPGVTATGQVPDVRPYLTSAGVFVAPLRIARGVQNKILEAMGAGLPVVCTTAALAGLDAVPGKHVLVGDTPKDFAFHTVSVLLNRDRAAELGRSAADFVRRYHRWEVQLERLETALLTVVQHQRNHALEVLD